MRRWALLLGLVAPVVVACAPASPEPEPSAGMRFGVLAASCTPERAAALRAAGVTVVELPLAWDRYQPVADEADPDYVADLRVRRDACRDAGLDVVLSPGLQYPPAWVRALPGGTLRGSSGGVPDGADLVFSSAVRDAVDDYLGRLAADLGFDGVTAVRVGTTATGELGFPGPVAAGNPDEYWAFGPAPQLGVGLAAGLEPGPLPGWVPGSSRWRGTEVTADQADAWWTWYAGSAAAAVLAQVDRLRELGFTGEVHVPVAGRGALPADRAAAVAGLLDGRADPDGALERGLDYPAQFAALAGAGVVVDFTGLDDVSAVRAREAGLDRCLPGDEHDLTARADVADWPPQRFTAAAARAAGLALVGENPGPPDAPFTGGSDDSDTLADQLRWAPSYAADCGLTTFLFAFEDDLFDGTSGVDVDDYAARIAAAGRG